MIEAGDQLKLRVFVQQGGAALESRSWLDISQWSSSAAPFSPSGASNQVHLQGLHALKSGIMVGAQLRRQFNDCGVQFDN